MRPAAAPLAAPGPLRSAELVLNRRLGDHRPPRAGTYDPAGG